MASVFGTWLCLMALLSGSLQIRSIDGTMFRPLEPSGLANVLLFVSTDCPVSNEYAPEPWPRARKPRSAAAWPTAR